MLNNQFDQYLSFKDLEKVDGWNEAVSKEDFKKILEILHTNGADLDYGWEVTKCLHRPRTPPQWVVDDFVVRFKERTDKEFEPYREIEDITRDTQGSISRYGMNLSLNTNQSLGNLVEDALSMNVRLIEMNRLAKELEKND